jgi:hypothetical protein
MREILTSMLGPSGVGKTSLLTAMYEQFETTVGAAELQLTPDEESSAVLQDRLAELRSLTYTFEATGGVSGTEAPAGPESLRKFTFDLGKKAAKPSLRVAFQDYPGAYHGSRAGADERAFVKRMLEKSAAVLIPVDAPPLLEGADAGGLGPWHERMNRPTQITDHFKRAYQNLEAPRLVVFTPTKCETYMKTEASRAALLAAVRRGYPRLFDLFASEGLRDRVAVVIAPVQTVGAVVFSRVEQRDGQPHFVFRKSSKDASYSPADSEQPLRYLLRFLLRVHRDERRWRYFDFLRDWLRLDRHLESAVRDFAAGCKATGGFEVVQGERLLEPPR